MNNNFFSQMSRYIEAGFTIIPTGKSTGKKPLAKNWQDRLPTDNDLKEFRTNSNYRALDLEGLPHPNIGIVLGNASGDIVDIDLDHPNAVAAAPYFLPKTTYVFGREGKPRSHWVYRVSDPGKTAPIKTKTQGMIVEYRANGGQTIFPPSINLERGNEVLRFDEEGEIGQSTCDDLLKAVKAIALMVVLIDHYRKGSRHLFALALSGFLLKNGMSKERASHFIETLAVLAGDDDAEDRITAVETTVERIAKNEHYTQWNELKALIGPDAAADVSKLLSLPNKGGARDNNHSPDSLKPEDRTDKGLAHLFVVDPERRGVMYVDELKCFYVFDGEIWKADPEAKATLAEFDRFVLRRIGKVKQRMNGQDSDADKEYGFLRAYRNLKNCRNAVQRASEELRVPLSKLDANYQGLPVRNGFYNFQTHELEAYREDHYVTGRSDIAFDPTADCPEFKAWLNQIFQEDEELIQYLKTIVGYLLTPDIARREFYILYGDRGMNGKSALCNIIRAILGPMSAWVMASTLFEQSGAAGTYDLADMMGKRVVIASEAESTQRLNSSLIKQITGENLLRVRLPYVKQFNIPITFKLLVMCNKKPKADGYDEALMDRARFIPFNFKITEKVEDLEGKLIAKEGSGILNFFLEGVRDYQQANGKVRLPRAVKEATKDYFAGLDSVSQFVEHSGLIVRQATGKIGGADFYQLYCEYCQNKSADPETRAQFTKIMTNKLGFAYDRSKTGMIWRGLALASDDDEDVVTEFPRLMARG